VATGGLREIELAFEGREGYFSPRSFVFYKTEVTEQKTNIQQRISLLFRAIFERYGVV
jgi:hypothetical protein